MPGLCTDIQYRLSIACLFRYEAVINGGIEVMSSPIVLAPYCDWLWELTVFLHAFESLH